MATQEQEAAAAAQLDEQDLQKVRSGDTTGFNGLVQRHYRVACGVALARLRDPEAAEEAAQEAFLRAWLSLDKLRDSTAFVPWLVSIARNSAIDWAKRNQRRSRLLPMIPMEEMAMEPQDSRTPSPREHLEEQQSARVLREAVLALPDPLREVVVLHYGEELTKSEIAHALDVHPSTVARQLERALEELRKTVEPQLTDSLKPLRSRPAAPKVTVALLAGAMAMNGTSKAALAAAANGIASVDAGNVVTFKPEHSPEPSPAITGRPATAGPLAGGGLKLLAGLFILLLSVPVVYSLTRPSSTGGATRTASTVANVSRSSGVVSSSTSRTPAPSSAAIRRRQPVIAPDASTTGVRVIITGRVVRPDGTPATAATVGLSRILYGNNGYQTRFDPVAQTSTDDEGRYRIEAEDSPLLSLDSREKGSGPVSALLLDRDVETRGLRQQGERRVERNLKLAAAAALRGTVRDDAGQPVSGARVMAAPPFGEESAPPAATAITESDGTFAFDDLPTGNILLRVMSEEHIALNKSVTAPADNLSLTLSSGGSLLSGRVVHKDGGFPVAGATISLLPGERPSHPAFPAVPYTATSGDSGEFTVERLPGGKFHVDVQKGGYMLVPPRSQEGLIVDLAEETTSSGLTLLLYSGHTIAGTVRVKETGAPVEGATLTFNGRESVTVVTDAQGRYKAEGVSSHGGPSVRYSASAPGYMISSRLPEKQRSWVELGEADRDVQLDLEAEQALTISGTVRDENGRPIPGSKVMVHTGLARAPESVTATAGPDGRYELRVTPGETILLKAYAPGYPVVLSGALRAIERPLTGVDFTAIPGVTVRTQVLDASGTAVPDAYVRIQSQATVGNLSLTEQILFEKTDVDGVLEARSLPLLPLSVSAEKPGFAASSVAVVTPSAEGSSANALTLILQPALELSGRITGEDGKPLNGVRLHANAGSPQPQGTTNADGRYTLKGLPPGEVTIYLNYSSGDYTASDQIENVLVGRTDADFVLKKNRMVHVRGRVVDHATRQPVAGFTVQDYGNNAVDTADAKSGRFEFFGVPGSTYVMSVAAPNYAATDFNLLIPTDRTELEHTVAMGVGGTVAGRVISSAGQAVAGAQIEVTNPLHIYHQGASRNVPGTETGSDGSFVVENVPAGRRVLQISTRDRSRTKKVRFESCHNGTVNLQDITLGAGAVLSGRLVKLPGRVGMPGETVELVPDQGATPPRKVVTDNGGGFLFEGLTDGQYKLRSRASADDVQVELRPDSRKEVTLLVGESVLEGTLSKCGKPQAGKLHLMRGASGQQIFREISVGAGGKFRAEGLPPGRWRLMGVGSRDLDLGPEVTQLHLEIPCEPLLVTVVDAGGKPVAGANVSAVSLDDYRDFHGQILNQTQGQTDAAGQFSVSRPAGLYNLSATTDDGAMALADQVTIPDSGSAPSVTLRLSSKGGTLVSTARNRDGIPLSQAQCRVTGDDGPLVHNRTRDQDGTVWIPAIPPGRYKVEIQQHETIVHDVEIRDGETVTLDDTLGPGGVLSWTLADEKGEPVVDVPVRIVRSDASAGTTARELRTNLSGIALGWFAEGNYTLTATPPGREPVTASVTIYENESHVIETVVR